LNDAILLAQYMRKTNLRPEQVQDFYPTPGTLSTAMFYTGLDPRTMQPIYVPKLPREKAMQRALMQVTRPENRELVLAALRQAGRTDLIGHGKDCLIAPSPKKDDTHETGKTHGESYSHAKNGRKLNGSKTTDKKRDDNRHEGNRRGKGDSEYARDSRSKGNTQKGASRNAVRSEKAPKHPPKGRKRR